MPARRVQGEPSVHTLSLGEAEPGTVFLYAAAQGGPESSVVVQVRQAHSFWQRQQSSDQATSCRIATPTWQPCRLPILGRGEAVLEVILQSPTTQALVSSPLMRADGARSLPNVFVVLADALRFETLETYTPSLPLGARIDALARDAIVFERTYSSSSWTRTAVATLLTGLDARSHGVLGRSDILPSVPQSLPATLQAAGWATSAWSTNANVLPIWGFGTGFDAFVDLGALEWSKRKTDAATVFAAVLEKLELNLEIPTFYYVHLMDTHGPYAPDSDDIAAVEADPSLAGTYPGRARDEKAQVLYRKYLGEIRDMDEKLGAFLDALRELDLYEDSLILFVADHGEEFFDHGGLYHGKTLYEEVLRVPAILKLPENAQAGTRIRGEIGLVDLAPTILASLGVPERAQTDGRNLWDPESKRVQDEGFRQNAVLRLDTHHLAALVQGGDKLIVDYEQGEQLFDLVTDPKEQTNLLPAAAPQASLLRATLNDDLARHDAGWHVRACGGGKPLHLRLVLQTSSEVGEVDFEHDDTVSPPGDGGVIVDLELSPRKVTRELFGRLIDEPASDEDEVTIAANGSPVVLRAVGNLPFAYALGTQAVRKVSAQLDLRPELTEAQVQATDTIDCWDNAREYVSLPAAATASRQAYLRVWYVAPAEHLEDSAVDPAVRERLRALGYKW